MVLLVTILTSIAVAQKDIVTVETDDIFTIFLGNVFDETDDEWHFDGHAYGAYHSV